MSTPEFDLVIRGGSVLDGLGNPAFQADVAIKDGIITEIGAVAGTGAEEIDAAGCLVTPGFVDVHTHYDGQATWENQMAPSSNHGVTTVVGGNCGVGFAPCRPGDRETLIAVMEGVEDIPGVVMAEGVPWNWETFPEYMDALAQRELDVDMAVQFPHAPLRVYVMGRRGAEREPSNDDDRAKMRALTTEAIKAGALGVTTSRSFSHRRRDGELAPTINSELEELKALAGGLRDAGAGVFQLLPDLSAPDFADELDVIETLAREAGRPLSFTLAVSHSKPDLADKALARLASLNAEGLKITAQVYPRPIGVLFGLDLSLHPFALRPSFRTLEPLPLADKVEAMRDPVLRARLLSETSDDPNPLLLTLCESWDDLYALGNPPDYSPGPEKRLGAIAAREGRTVEEVTYDALLEDEGRAILYRPGTNFIDGKLDAARKLVAHPASIIGLGDGGAHYGMICDAAYTTYMLTRWTRDAAPDEAFDLPWVIQAMTSRPAELVGLGDRGRLAVGFKADINVIDFEGLTLEAPRMQRDLPAGGKRLTQRAQGYRAAIVSGQVTARDGVATGALPGRLVRGARG